MIGRNNRKVKTGPGQTNRAPAAPQAKPVTVVFRIIEVEPSPGQAAAWRELWARLLAPVPDATPPANPGKGSTPNRP